MSGESPPVPTAAAVGAKLDRGFQLRRAGDNDGAVAIWDEILAIRLDDAGQEVKLAVAETMNQKAYLLSELGDAPQAEALAQRAAELAASVDLPRAGVIEASAVGLRSSLILDRGELALAASLDEQVAAKFAGSDSAEVRLGAARHLRQAIWIHVGQRDHARAVTAATQLREMLCLPLQAASELIEATELLLSSAETLSAQPVWRRVPADLRAQAQSMIDSAVHMADHTGGEVGAAVSVNAHIAEGDLRGREHRLRASYRHKLERPLVGENDLSALQEVQEAAEESGSRFRALRLLIVRAESLAQLERTSEALALLDQALTKLEATPGVTARGDAFFVRAARNAIAG